ncbi:hypothetical protein JD489_06195 [Aeromonas veronii]|nr:hypothetical protein [Aeromonas veronii]MCJ7975694.1 hypothetical protein [Aeromonas veronii]
MSFSLVRVPYCYCPVDSVANRSGEILDITLGMKINNCCTFELPHTKLT